MEIILLNRENEILDIITRKHIISLEFEDIINDFGKGFFDLSIDKSNELKDFLKMNNRFIIRDGNKVMFGGHIFGIVPSYGLTNRFYIQNLLGMLEKRILRDNFNLNGLTITQGLEQILTHINLYENINIDLICNINEVIIGGEYEKQTNVYNLLKDLLNRFDFIIQPKIEQNIVKFELIVGNIGIDRTFGNNYKEYKITLGDSKKGNIKTLSSNIDFNYYSNYVLGNLGETFDNFENITSIEEFGLIEDSLRVNNNLQDEIENYILEHSEYLKGLNLSNLTLDYFEVGLGDKVKIIANGNDLLKLDDNIKVLSKKFTLRELSVIEIKFNTSNVIKLNFIEDFSNIKNKVLKL